MVVPAEIASAAARGDSERVLAWLDADVSEPRDINDVDETGKTLLYSSTGASKRMHYRHLALVRELINRGADVNKRGSATVGLLGRSSLVRSARRAARGLPIDGSPAKASCDCGVWSSATAPDPVVARRAPPIRSSPASSACPTSCAGTS